MFVIQKVSMTVVLAVTIVLFSGHLLAQSVTIGGTLTNAPGSRFMSLFMGNIFENFRHIERFAPVSTMRPSSDPWRLESKPTPVNFNGTFLDRPTELDEFIDISNTSAFLILKDEKLIYEDYRHGDSRTSLHVSFSLAKSFVSTLIGIALEEGFIKSLDDHVQTYLPELTSLTFDNVTIKHVLQMSSGVRFDETYTDPNSDINKMTQLVLEMSHLDYINTLKRDHKPGVFNHYASINTQILGILLTRVTGRTLTEYMSEKLWQPLGMESRGQWILDEQGYELAMGGMSASARDYAKLGLLFLNEGKRDRTKVISASWVEEAVTPTKEHLLPGEQLYSSNTAGYQYQWWTPRNWDDDFLARGIWGQTIFIHPRNDVVIVKLAADRANFETRIKLAYIDYIQELAQSLSD